MKNKINIIDDSGIVEKHSNNGKTQTILLEYESLYKIEIHVESYEFQSYAKLCVLNSNKNWTTLKEINPKSMGITNFYYPYSKDVFKPIIDKLKDILSAIGTIIKKETYE